MPKQKQPECKCDFLDGTCRNCLEKQPEWDTPNGQTYFCSHTTDDSICEKCLGKPKCKCSPEEFCSICVARWVEAQKAEADKIAADMLNNGLKVEYGEECPEFNLADWPKVYSGKYSRNVDSIMWEFVDFLLGQQHQKSYREGMEAAIEKAKMEIETFPKSQDRTYDRAYQDSLKKLIWQLQALLTQPKE